MRELYFPPASKTRQPRHVAKSQQANGGGIVLKMTENQNFVHFSRGRSKFRECLLSMSTLRLYSYASDNFTPLILRLAERDDIQAASICRPSVTAPNPAARNINTQEKGVRLGNMRDVAVLRVRKSVPMQGPESDKS